MKSILLLTAVSLSLTGIAQAGIKNRVSHCVEKVMSRKRVDVDTLKRLSTLVTDVGKTDPRESLKSCRSIKKDSKDLDRLGYEKLKTLIEGMAAKRDLTKSVANLFAELAYPNLACTIYGANIQAGYILVLGAGFYAGTCIDRLKRKAQIIAPAGVLGMGLGASIFFEAADIEYVLKKDRKAGFGDLYGIPGVGKYCEGEPNHCMDTRGTALGLLLAIAGQGFVPIKLHLQTLDYETLIQNN